MSQDTDQAEVLARRQRLCADVPKDLAFVDRIRECVQMEIPPDSDDATIAARRKVWTGICARRMYGLPADAPAEDVIRKAEEHWHRNRMASMDM